MLRASGSRGGAAHTDTDTRNTRNTRSRTPHATPCCDDNERGAGPKLVEQVQSEKLAVKRNALSVLCGEFSNPMSIRGCVEAGIMQV